MNQNKNNNEIERILLCIPKPCPNNFPEKLKKYWNVLQYTMCPIQSGWLLYYQDRDKNK